MAPSQMLYSLLDTNASLHPNKIAVEVGGLTYSYNELQSRVNALGLQLQNHADISGKPVVVLLPRGIDLLVSILAINACGATFVSLDQDVPQQRMDIICEDSQAALVITTRSLNCAVSNSVPSYYVEDTNWEQKEVFCAQPLGDQPVYIMYTSGTTGKPKGVPISDSNLTAFKTAVVEEYNLFGSDRMLQFSTVAFDIFIEELIMWLSVGATLIVRDENISTSTQIFWEFIDKHQVSVISLPTAFWHLLCSELNNGFNPDLAKTLRLAALGGEAMSAAMLQQWRQVFGESVPVLNVYGPTEVTVGATVFHSSEWDDELNQVPIGHCFPGVKHKILNAQGDDCAENEIGELYLGGAQVSQGYLNRPELNEQVFVSFDGVPYFKTGDLVKEREGNLWFIGRNDSQVKVSGYRVEPKEIEQVIYQVDEVKAVHIEASKSGISAYLVFSPEVNDAQSALATLVEHISACFPSYMMPRQYFQVKHIPLNVNGKVDVPKLQVSGELIRQHTHSVLESETEEKLADIWANALSYERTLIGRQDSLFELGGNSIAIVKIRSAISQHFGKVLSIQQLYEASTLASLAQVIDDTEPSNNKVLSPAAVNEEVTSLEASFQQTSVWLHERVAQEHTLYNLVFVRDADESFNFDAAEKAINEIVSRHITLRTHFVFQHGELLQRIADDIPVQPIVVKAGSDSDVKQKLAVTISHECDYCFDTASEHPIRVLFVQGETSGALIFNIHHIAFDGWSLSVLEKEFKQAYSKYAGDVDAVNALPPLELNYIDYSKWQKSFVESGQYLEQLQFWKKQLANLPQCHGLPLDFPRPDKTDFSGQNLTFQLDIQTSLRLETLASSLNASLFVVVHALFSTLIARHSNQQDIVIGVPFANRPDSRLEKLIGLFADSIVMRVNCHNDLNFSELVEQVKQVSLNAQNNGNIPFVHLANELDFERTENIPPLFQIMMNMDEVEFNKTNVSEFKYFEPPSSKVDLTLNIRTSVDGLKFEINYNTSLFKEETIKGYQHHLVNLIRSAIVDPGCNIYDLAMLSSQEESELLQLARGPLSETVHQENWVELFEQQAARSPHAIAIVDESGEFTYEQINEQVQRVAVAVQSLSMQHKAAQGVEGISHLVALQSPRDHNMLVMMLGVLKAGCAFLSLDPNNPLSRAHYIIQDAKPLCLLSADEDYWQGEMPAEVPVLNMKSIMEQEQGEYQYCSRQPNDLMYVIYTSGSTGNPKGVMVEDAQFSNFMAGFDKQFKDLGIASLSNWLVTQSFSFDASLKGLGLLCQGIKLVVASEDQMTTPEQIWQLVEEHRIEVVNSTPSMISTLIDFHSEEQYAPHFIASGEDISYSVFGKIKDYCQRFERAALNVYGPTETTINAAYGVLEDGVDIGRPMQGVTAYVLGENLSLLPKGTIGELCIGGRGVARGYLNRAEQTQAVFVDCPYSQNERLYRTGDFVKLTENGKLQFAGRRDEQIKIRGYRVELEEVERVIVALPEVSEVKVLFKQDTQQLIAFVSLPSTIESMDADAVRAFQEQLRVQAKDNLPTYMQPSRFQFVDEWPTTGHGKLDTKALLATEAEIVIASDGAGLPVTEMEKQLADIWSRLLDVPLSQIHLHDSFFDLGGHSLSAMSLVAEIQIQFDATLIVSDILGNAVFADLIRLIEQHQGRHSLASIPRQEDSSRYLASYTQNNFWFVENLSETGKHFNVVSSIKLDKNYDVEKLKQALQLMTQRHEILRTNFEYDEMLWQRVHQEWQVPFKELDLSHCNEHDKQRAFSECLDNEYGLKRDLTNDPLMSATLVRMSDCAVLLLNLHHIITDGWSNQVLAQEFSLCLNALEHDKQADLPALPIQYRDYAIWQREEIKRTLADNIVYWGQRLKGLPEVHKLPLDYNRPSLPSSVGAYHYQHIEHDVFNRLSRLFLDNKSTMFVGLQTLFATFIARMSGETDVVLGTANANRNHPDTHHLVGAFVDTLVLRNQLNMEQDFVAQLAQTRDENLKDRAHFDMPFESLVRSLNPERNSSYSPLFQLVLNLVYSDDDIQEVADLERGESQYVNVNYDLTLYAKPTNKGLELTWCYATDLFKAGSIETMAYSFAAMLEAVVKNPNSPLGELPLVNTQDSHELEMLAQGESLTVPVKLIPEQISILSQTLPSATAVVMEDESLTFSELEAQANRLAQGLIKAGVKVGDRVGLSLQRSLEMVVAVAGIMKSGGVYVPLDPTYPDERLSYLINDADISHVVTEDFLADQLPLHNQKVLLVSDYLDNDTDGAVEAVNVEVQGDYPAYMIYTSGSTGNPKGVVVSHGALAKRIAGLQHHYQLNSEDRGLLFASMSFDASLSQLLMPLCSGAAVVVRPDDITEPDALMEYLQETGVSFLHVVPVYLKQLVTVPGWSESRLRIVVSGGDIFDKSLLDSWYKGEGASERQGIKLYNSYGPTEIVITSSSHRVTGDEAVVPIGKPLAYSSYWVVDAQGQLLPKGVVGELCIGGDCIADGYWLREEQTAAQFVNLQVNGKALSVYRTGDRGYWNGSGELICVGRQDNQVKVRGYRIELGEIEAALKSCTGVTEAVVKAEDDALWAFVTADNVELTQIEDELAIHLPAYLLPSGIEKVTEWPLTRSGKIDRNKLERGLSSDSGDRPPTSETELALHAIWCDLLKLEAISATDNFFNIGGHSLLATRLASQIRRNFDVDFTLKSLFESPSIEEQAMFIDLMQKNKAASSSNDGKDAVEEFSL
ncbi:amino acid adenylation domain-containing protein [Paraneptunicella aestuarii]|uniref:non-ribosomal peptide synthetase n=1 Tax=Paraneptunicella aestuarii TaxID=2831148 RepID=UPI001E5119BD|nr:non-ribosomal peptide synthetase [Paraneptunicella aestuarii]UAA37426.1 amino acid adenylation domain-containing protein [Paraneptunicella aestuarii]